MYAYHDYVRTLAKRFEAALGEIDAIYNFDYGDEFEVALCKILRSALPERFGICRGHVVDADGQEAGDDIIIYDSQRFPTLRLHPKSDYSRKEWIPLESVYAYIEAKHTLQLEGDCGSSLRHAIEQVSNVKLLCNSREAVDRSHIRPYLNLSGLGMFQFNTPQGFPDRLNPCFTAIFARRVRAKSKDAVFDDGSQITPLLDGVLFPLESCPDVIVAGPHNVMLPTIYTDATRPMKFASPFYVPGIKRPASFQTDNRAFGIGLSVLLFALDWINLGQMNWPKIILDSLNREAT
jgi:hypothetical protein